MRISDWSSDVCSSDLIESGLSMTGTNADIRIPVKPSQQGIAALALYNEIAKLAGTAGVQAGELSEAASRKIKEAATGLWTAKGQRSEERRVGEECVSTCRSRGSPDS